jgi:hypothetical protein
MIWYKLTSPLIINEASESPIHADVGQIVYINSDGTLGICEEAEIPALSVRVDEEIAANVAAEAAWNAAHPPGDN